LDKINIRFIIGRYYYFDAYNLDGHNRGEYIPLGCVGEGDNPWGEGPNWG